MILSPKRPKLAVEKSITPRTTVPCKWFTVIYRDEHPGTTFEEDKQPPICTGIDDIVTRNEQEPYRRKRRPIRKMRHYL